MERKRLFVNSNSMDASVEYHIFLYRFVLLQEIQILVVYFWITFFDITIFWCPYRIKNSDAPELPDNADMLSLH